jgi:hypothetical protein
MDHLEQSDKQFTYGADARGVHRQGDQTANNIQFRSIFNPVLTPALTRVTPVHNFVDDVTFVKDNHTFQFGGNIRLIKNTRQSFSKRFRTLTTNPSGYNASSAVLTSAGADASGSRSFRTWQAVH